jgi:hypothetical protein
VRIDPTDVLIEATLSAYRERDADGLPRPSGAWRDLPLDARERAFVALVAARRLEALLSEDGLSSTARAVLARI